MQAVSSLANLMHTIRLRGPWNYELVDSSGESKRKLLDSGKISLPTDLASRFDRLANGSARACFSRAFNLPTGIEADDTIWLVVQNIDVPFRLDLNGHLLDNDQGSNVGGWRYDVSSLLRARNALRLIIPPALRVALPVEVELQIQLGKS